MSALAEEKKKTLLTASTFVNAANSLAYPYVITNLFPCSYRSTICCTCPAPIVYFGILLCFCLLFLCIIAGNVFRFHRTHKTTSLEIDNPPKMTKDIDKMDMQWYDLRKVSYYFRVSKTVYGVCVVEETL